MKCCEYIVSDPPSETPCQVNQVYSIILYTKSSDYLYQMATGENRLGSKQMERERERAADWQSERWNVGQKQKWSELEMAISEKGHLSISNKANQLNKSDVNQKG